MDVIKAAHVLAGEQLTQERVRRISIRAPLKLVIEKLKDKGFYHPKINRPMANIKLSMLDDTEIIILYSAIMYGLLNWYRCADNFPQVKGIIAALRKSCIFTLARKHKKTKVWAYRVFGDDVAINMGKGKKISLPSRQKVTEMGTKFLINTDDKGTLQSPFDSLLKNLSYRMTLKS